MDRKKEAVGLLRQYDALRQARENLRALVGLEGGQALIGQLYRTEKTLEVIRRGLAALTPEERLILSRFYIYREKGHAQRLCQTLSVEQSSVYRRKDQAVEKFTEAVYGERRERCLTTDTAT